jgi:eukaryotic-like serine/threonine-protein kinase
VSDLRAQALDLFEEALAQPEETREAWLEQRCQDHPELRTEVDLLLRADAAAPDVMPSEGLGLAGALGPMPERIGAYRIVERLGAGGMGEVFLGARDDGLFEHDVAIKLIRPSLLPHTARAMFEKERRVLARLGHTNIARLFDGGVTENGAQYFIMELVRGIEISAFCRSRKSSQTSVARLMIDVCSAVQFAHQNLVVHGDLKPANILVDESGQAKVLDFGVARVLADADNQPTDIFPKTPAYSSPARLSGAAPATADDVFALGVILNQLVADTGAAIPSDLAAVIAKAREPDQSQRYPTAAALADDLRRWLEHRPLAARENDFLYSARKFVRRRRLRVIFGALAVIGLVGALAVTANLYITADRERILAQRRFDDTRRLANYLLFDLYDEMARKPNSLALRNQVAAHAHSYLRRLAADAGAGDDIQRDVVHGFVRLADIQAGIGHSNLGDTESAKLNWEQAARFAEILQQRHPDDEQMALTRALIAQQRAALAMAIDQDFDGAERFLGMAATLLEASSAEPQHAVLQAEQSIQRSVLAQWRGDYPTAIENARAAVAQVDALNGKQKLISDQSFQASRAHDTLAEALYYADKVEEALAEYRRAVALGEQRASGTDDISVAAELCRAHWALGTTLMDSPPTAREALRVLNRGRAQCRRVVEFEPQDQRGHRMERLILTAYAQALSFNGQFREAVTLMRGLVAERAAIRAARPNEALAARDYAVILGMLADIYADRRDSGNACPLYASAIREYEQLAQSLSPLDVSHNLNISRTRFADLCQ